MPGRIAIGIDLRQIHHAGARIPSNDHHTSGNGVEPRQVIVSEDLLRLDAPEGRRPLRDDDEGAVARVQDGNRVQTPLSVLLREAHNGQRLDRGVAIESPHLERGVLGCREPPSHPRAGPCT